MSGFCEASASVPQRTSMLDALASRICLRIPDGAAATVKRASHCKGKV
jgi:hypothetical protein